MGTGREAMGVPGERIQVLLRREGSHIGVRGHRRERDTPIADLR